METIYISKTDKGFVIQQGNKYADMLCTDEALALAFHLITKADPKGVERYDIWMQTRDGHNRHADMMKRIFDKSKEDAICGR